jgi:hypothetical protein
MKSENINIIPYWKIVEGLNYFKENNAKNILEYLLFINETALNIYNTNEEKEFYITDLVFIKSIPIINENRILNKLIINDCLIEDEELVISNNKIITNKKINLIPSYKKLIVLDSYTHFNVQNNNEDVFKIILCLDDIEKRYCIKEAQKNFFQLEKKLLANFGANTFNKNSYYLTSLDSINYKFVELYFDKTLIKEDCKNFIYDKINSIELNNYLDSETEILNSKEIFLINNNEINWLLSGIQEFMSKHPSGFHSIYDFPTVEITENNLDKAFYLIDLLYQMEEMEESLKILGLDNPNNNKIIKNFKKEIKYPKDYDKKKKEFQIYQIIDTLNSNIINIKKILKGIG